MQELSEHPMEVFMANVMNSWLEQANNFAEYLADEARKLVTDVKQAGYEDYDIVVSESNEARYDELIMLAVSARDIAHVIESEEIVTTEIGRNNLKAYLREAFETAAKFSSPEAEKVRKAARRVGAKLFGIAL